MMEEKECSECGILMRQTSDGLMVKSWVCDGCGNTITEHKCDEGNEEKKKEMELVKKGIEEGELDVKDLTNERLTELLEYEEMNEDGE